MVIWKLKYDNAITKWILWVQFIFWYRWSKCKIQVTLLSCHLCVHIFLVLQNNVKIWFPVMRWCPCGFWKLYHCRIVNPSWKFILVILVKVYSAQKYLHSTNFVLDFKTQKKRVNMFSLDNLWHLTPVIIPTLPITFLIDAPCQLRITLTYYLQR